MILFGLEEFTARRRKAQTDLEGRLRPLVKRALDKHTNTHGWQELVRELGAIWRDVYREESGSTASPLMPGNFRRQVYDTLIKTDRVHKTKFKTTEDRIVVWLATAILSSATMRAAQDDPEELLVEWVTMEDKAVRETHQHAHGQQRPIGDNFRVGGYDMPYPGYPGVPIELWINCRCTLRPTLANEVTTAVEGVTMGSEFRDVSRSEREKDAKAGRAMPDGSYPIDNCSDLRNAIQAIGRAKDPGKVKAHIRRRKSSLGCPDVELPEDWSAEAHEFADDRSSLSVVVALPAEDSPVHRYGDEQKHLTIAFLGEFDGDAESLAADVARVASDFKPFDAAISGTATLGADRAQVLLVEATEIETLRRDLMNSPGLAAAVGEADAHPHFVPHVTLSYEPLEEDVDMAGQPLTFDRLALWHGSEQTEYALGGAVDPENETPDTEIEELPEPTEGEPLPEEAAAVPWHGVLAPEGIASGDGRKFAEGALRFRPLPLPLTWQKISDDGHKGNVTVAKIDRIARVGTEMRASGTVLNTPEADEVMGLLAEFGKFGVSIDADDAQFELDEDEEQVVFTDARISSACIVPIPAFAEAWVALGDAPEDFLDGEEVEIDEDPDALAAAGALAEFVDVAPGRTEDGPGWLTHPVDTDRLRDYWVRGPGAAKINWGTPGDFNRCRVNVAEYVKPQHLNGYCANRHFDALGFWPGQGPHAGESEQFAGEEAQSVSLVAAATHLAPAEWFTDPQLERLTPLTVTDEGRVFGHLAGWDTCHTSWSDVCTTPPTSASDYAYFLTGEVATANGTVPVGQITLGGGHADTRLGWRPAAAHYDSTSAAVCDIAVGEDAHGIWFSGWVRPGVSDDMVTALRASALSGDWRKINRSGGLELIAALAVNTPGFPVPRLAASSSGTQQLSLVASGIVQQEEGHAEKFDVETIAAAVATHLRAIDGRREKMSALAARFKED